MPRRPSASSASVSSPGKRCRAPTRWLSQSRISASWGCRLKKLPRSFPQGGASSTSRHASIAKSWRLPVSTSGGFRIAPMHVKTYFEEVGKVAQQIDLAGVEKLAQELKALRDRGGRLFFLGVGGSAGNCGHAVNDFRKLCGIEAYAPT